MKIIFIFCVAFARCNVIRLPGCNVSTLSGFPDGYPSPPGAPYINPVAGFTDGMGTSVKFNTPLGVVVNSTGFIFVADKVNRVLRSIRPDGLVSTIFAIKQNGKFGAQPPFDCDDTIGSSDCDGPNAVSIDPSLPMFNPLVFIVTNRTLYSFASTDTYAAIVPGGLNLFQYAVSVVVDGETPNVLYVGDHVLKSILKVVVSSNPTASVSVSLLAGGKRARECLPHPPSPFPIPYHPCSLCSHTPPPPPPAGRDAFDGVGSNAQFAGMGGLVLDNSFATPFIRTNYLYVADYGANIIRRVDVRTGNVTTPIGDVTLSNGIEGAANPSRGNKDGPASNASFIFPYGLAYIGRNLNSDPRTPDTLVISDSGNNALRLVSVFPDGTFSNVSTIAGADSLIGGGWMDGLGAYAYFNENAGISYSGNSLIVADAVNHAIRRVICEFFPVPPFPSASPNPPERPNNAPDILGPKIIGDLRAGALAIIIAAVVLCALIGCAIWWWRGRAGSTDKLLPTSSVPSLNSVAVANPLATAESGAAAAPPPPPPLPGEIQEWGKANG